jgi:hypothetical protein
MSGQRRQTLQQIKNLDDTAAQQGSPVRQAGVFSLEMPPHFPSFARHRRAADEPTRANSLAAPVSEIVRCDRRRLALARDFFSSAGFSRASEGQ